MSTLKDLYEQITEELADAHHYIKWALATRDTDQTLSRLLYQLSEEEMDHAGRLTDAAKRYAEGTAVSEDARMFIEYIKEIHLRKTKDVRVCQSLYKE